MSLKEFVLERRILFLTWAAGLLLILQVFNLHSYAVRAVDHQAVIAAMDDDASWNIEKTVKTRWWKDNGWVLYGPLYFRINHTINYLWQRTANPGQVGESEAWEMTAHHAILTVSVLAVTALSLLIATALLAEWWTRLLFAFAMNAALLSNSDRTEFVVRAHPDHLLALFTCSAFFLMVLMLMKSGEDIWRKLSAVMWGFTVAIKMTVVICAPGFVLLFVPPFTKENFKRGLKYLGIMLLAYFLIGFPQTIVVDRPFRDLKMMDNITHRATAETLAHFFATVWSQMWGPLLVIALACVFLGSKRVWPRLEKHFWIRLGIFVVVPFFMLMKNKMLVPSDHYPLPFVGMVIVLAAFAASYIPVASLKYPWVRAAAFFAVAMAIWGSTPQTLQASLVKTLNCREGSREAYQTIAKFYNDGEKVWVDPYVPYFIAGDKSRMVLSWEKTWKEQEEKQFGVIAISGSYRARYTQSETPDSYTTTEHPNWREIQEFYRSFNSGDQAKSPAGAVFKRVYMNNCGHEVWRKEK